MKLATVAINEKGKALAIKIRENLPECHMYAHKNLKEDHLFTVFSNLEVLVKNIFNDFDGIIFCMAAGIVVRAISPHVKDKYTDPAVVVVDGEGRFAISLLSGHERGANKLALQVANILGAEPVITTATESRKNIIVGLGARRGVKKTEIIDAIKYALSKIKSDIERVRYIATIDLKQHEPGLREACGELGIPLRIISSEVIKNFKGSYQRSDLVKRKIGVEGVSEPCALLAARNPELILKKEKLGSVTVAVTLER